MDSCMSTCSMLLGSLNLRLCSLVMLDQPMQRLTSAAEALVRSGTSGLPSHALRCSLNAYRAL